MSVITSPPILMLINADLTASVIDTFTRQMFLTQVLDKATFDGYIASNPQWVIDVDGYNHRILVLGDLSDHSNRSLFDMVLFAKAGLVSVECNLLGPPQITLPIDKVYITQLIYLNRPKTLCHVCRCCYNFYSDFPKYRTSNCDFNPHRLDCSNVEPVSD